MREGLRGEQPFIYGFLFILSVQAIRKVQRAPQNRMLFQKVKKQEEGKPYHDKLIFAFQKLLQQDNPYQYQEKIWIV